MHSVDRAAKEVQQKLMDEAEKQVALDKEAHSNSASQADGEIAAAKKTLLEIKLANRENEQLLRKVRHST